MESKLPNSVVQILSVKDTRVDGVDYCDVRIAARGSPYYPPSKLNGIIEQNRATVCIPSSLFDTDIKPGLNSP